MVTVAWRPWLTVAALVLVLASGTVYAHRGATGIVKKRPPFDGPAVKPVSTAASR